MNKAIFLDRDGVLNEIIYHEEIGVIDTPFTPEQFILIPGAGVYYTKHVFCHINDSISRIF